MTTTAWVVERPRIVEKPWGREEIFALVEGKYCGKVLHVRSGHALSLQFHRYKDEVIFVLHGVASVEVGDAVDQLSGLILHEGESLHLPPGRLHRIRALGDLVLLEASTTELDDVVRLSDDYGRADRAASMPGQRAVAETRGGAS